jgi:hypothetical protein
VAGKTKTIFFAFYKNRLLQSVDGGLRQRVSCARNCLEQQIHKATKLLTGAPGRATWDQNTPAKPDQNNTTIMSKIRIANPQPGCAKYTTANQAERYLRRKEAVIINGMLHFLFSEERRRKLAVNPIIHSERHASDVYVTGTFDLRIVNTRKAECGPAFPHLQWLHYTK